MSYIYCLYSTEDGKPRYVGRANDKVSYRFKQHITAALDKEPGPVYDWMRDVWRRNHDIAFYILQQGIVPIDVDLFEKYWIDQFTDLLNVIGNKSGNTNSPIANQITTAIQLQIKLTSESNPSSIK